MFIGPEDMVDIKIRLDKIEKAIAITANVTSSAGVSGYYGHPVYSHYTYTYTTSPQNYTKE